jgi:hypothetical protein
MRWMIVDRRDYWSTRSHCHLSAQCSTGVSDRERAKRSEMLRINKTWVGSGTMNYQTRTTREGKETSIRSKANSRRVFDVVIGQGLLREGWIKEAAAARFRLH